MAVNRYCSWTVLADIISACECYFSPFGRQRCLNPVVRHNSHVLLPEFFGLPPTSITESILPSSSSTRSFALSATILEEGPCRTHAASLAQ